jgi:hypothetical protein
MRLVTGHLNQYILQILKIRGCFNLDVVRFNKKNVCNEWDAAANKSGLGMTAARGVWQWQWQFPHKTNEMVN